MSHTRSSPSHDAGREIVRRYALTWAAVPRHGHSGREEGSAAVLLMDPFAGADGRPSEPIEPIGVAVARRLPAGVRVILGDEDPRSVQWLEDHVRGGAPAAAVDLREWTAASWDRAAEEIGSVTEALVLLDPPRADALPWNALARLLAQPAAELLIRFPTAELRRLANSPTTPLADLPPYGRRAVEGLSLLLGDPGHGWFLEWRAEGGVVGERVMERFHRRLATAGGGSVGRVTADAGDGETVVLFLVGGGRDALRMNEILLEGRREGWLPWPERPSPWIRYSRSADLQLFEEVRRPPERSRRVDRSLLAHSLARRFCGRTLSLVSLARELAGEDVLFSELRRALTDLRTDGRARFQSLASAGCPICFPRTRLRSAAPGRRRSRAGEQNLALEIGIE